MHSSLLLSFPNDDWLGVLLYRITPKDMGPFHPYGMQQWSFGKLYDLIGYQPFWFYFTSLILRSLAAFSILYLTYNITKNKIASFVAGLLFALGFTGLETTDVVNNSNTYLSITLILFSTVYLFKLLQKYNFRDFIMANLLYFLSIIVAPIRVFAFIIWFSTSVLFLIKRPPETNFKKLAFLFTSLTLITLFLVRMGTFGSTNPGANSFLNSFEDSVTTISQSVLLGDNKYIKYFAIGIANAIVPEPFMDRIAPNQILNKVIGVSYIAVVSLFTLFLLLKRNKPIILTYLAMFLFWLPLFYFAYWSVWLQREPYLTSYRRYMTVPFAGFIIAFGLVVSLLEKARPKDKYLKLGIYAIAFTFVFIHARENYLYLYRASADRNSRYISSIWSQLQEDVPRLPPDEPSFFYFSYDKTSTLAYNTLIADFPTHAAVVYKIPPYPPANPLPVTSLDELALIVNDGSPLVKHGYKPEPVPWSRIFAFKLAGDKLVNIKAEVKKAIVQKESIELR
jgi:hypothetical protein